MRARVERRLGGSLAGAIEGLEITVTRERGGFVATIDARAITVAHDLRTLPAVSYTQHPAHHTKANQLCRVVS